MTEIQMQRVHRRWFIRRSPYLVIVMLYVISSSEQYTSISSFLTLFNPHVCTIDTNQNTQPNKSFKFQKLKAFHHFQNCSQFLLSLMWKIRKFCITVLFFWPTNQHAQMYKIKLEQQCYMIFLMISYQVRLWWKYVNEYNR